MTKEDPVLHINFTDIDGEKERFTFLNPTNIITAWNVDEVMPCLETVQQAVNDGYYAAGYLTYEAAPAFDPEYQVLTGSKLPLLWFGVFEKPTTGPLTDSEEFQINNWKPSVSVDHYNKNIDEIHRLIRDNETEQVNYTIHLESDFKGDPSAYYKQLEQVQSNYSAYMDIGDFSILSASPELFFQLKDGEIKTKPMKGTIGRGKTYKEDMENAAWLSNSKKNRTENEMIVKLMSSDLEKIAVPGSIHTTKKYEIEKYPTVYQMTSTVTAEMSPNKSVMDIFKALFPSGSITGLPKKNTMRIITELESAPREIYCGTLGFIKPNQEAIFNVPIRTVLIDNRNGKAEYGVGGGITIDSTKEEEYEEVLIKASVLTEKHEKFQLLESLGLFDGEFLVLENHLNRLTQSAAYFDFQLDRDKVRDALFDIAREFNTGQRKVRLTVDKDGTYSLEQHEIIPIQKKVVTSLAKHPINKDELFLYHKTTNRNVYESHINEEVFDVLLWNDDKEVTEFTMGNIVVELDNKLYTPPIESGLLAGTYRGRLLSNEEISERVIKLEELERCERIWFINSVREWVPVQLNLS